MKTITFYSYKGGVGRSLALTNIALRLAEFGKKVCLLDFDLEAPGLPIKFEKYTNKKIEKGIVDYIYEYTNNGTLPSEIRQYCIKLNNNIELIPSGNTDSREYWRKLSSIDWYNLVYENPNSISFFLDLKEKIKKQINPDFLLIDSRTGISEMSGITISLLADDVVIVSANNEENLRGCKKIIKSLLDVENAILGEVPKITFVLSRIPFTENNPIDKTKEQLLIAKIKSELSLLKIDEINVIHSDRELEERETIKIGYSQDDSSAQIAKDYLNLFEKLTVNDLSKDEIALFNNMKRAQKLFQQASNPNYPDGQKLNFINQAIILNNRNPQYFIFRGNLLESQGDISSAIDNYREALLLDPKDANKISILGNALLENNNNQEAAMLFEKLLETDNNDVNALFGLFILHNKNKNYEKAFDYINKAIDIEPNNPFAYNNRSNVNRLRKRYDNALKDIYKSLELNSNFAISYATLAEIYADLGKVDEFYINLETALKMDSKKVEKWALQKEDIYKQFIDKPRFIALLEKYNVMCSL